MCDLKIKYVNSIQLYYLIYLSVKTHNPSEWLKCGF
jgi:hypothetical protein